MNETRQRLFFALWPTDEMRADVARQILPLTQGARGRSVPTANLHVTLAFLGGVTADERRCMEVAAAGMAGEQCELVLDHLHHIRRSGILWLGASVVPPALASLADALTQAQRACGLAGESRPFRAHMTLMRHAKVRKTPELVQPIRWELDEFVLVESHTLPAGAHYTVVQRYPLRK